MSDLPSTIYNPAVFNESLAAGFDGVFDWSWTDGCFGETKITPMDFDGVIERRGNFLVIESKKMGCEVPKGQLITLDTAHKIGVFTILFIWGKSAPEKLQIWYPGNHNNEELRGKKSDVHATTKEKAKEIVRRWYEHANKNPSTGKVDVEFLRRRVTTLQEELSQAKKHAEKLVETLGGTVQWVREKSGAYKIGGSQ